MLILSILWQAFRDVPTYILVTNNVLAIHVFQERHLEIELNTRPGQMHESPPPQMTPLSLS